MRSLQPNLRGTNVRLMRLMQTVISLELLKTSNRIFLNTCTLNDTLILPNSAGEYSGVLVDIDFEIISLTQILSTLATRCAQIFIRYRSPIGISLVNKLTHPNIRLMNDENIYPSGWIGENYAVSGSIEFLRDQVALEENEVNFVTDENDVHKIIMNAETYW